MLSKLLFTIKALTAISLIAICLPPLYIAGILAGIF